MKNLKKQLKILKKIRKTLTPPSKIIKPKKGKGSYERTKYII